MSFLLVTETPPPPPISLFYPQFGLIKTLPIPWIHGPGTGNDRIERWGCVCGGFRIMQVGNKLAPSLCISV